MTVKDHTTQLANDKEKPLNMLFEVCVCGAYVYVCVCTCVVCMCVGVCGWGTNHMCGCEVFEWVPVLKLLLFLMHFPMGIGGASIIGHSAPTVCSSEQHAEQTYHVGVSANTPYLGHSIPEVK